MFIVYYDESGDDGYPSYSSPLFTLTCMYIFYLNWKDTFNLIREFRQSLRNQYGLPIKMEIHTKQLLLNKYPYKPLGLSEVERVSIIDHFCQFLASLDFKVVNVVIDKAKITNPDYGVLDRAFTYSIQRVENDLEKVDPSHRFLIITDEGRVGKMTKVARRIQRINYIPSQFSSTSYRKEIRRLIEDPLPKRSDQSYFIQIADLIAYIVYLHKLIELCRGNFPSRMPGLVDHSKILSWLDILSPILNLQASSTERFGIVCYPK